MGAGLFLLHHLVGAPEPQQLRLRAERVAAIESERARALGRVPTAEEIEAAIQAAVDEELAVREARALGLEDGDPIVRRRLLQKVAALDLLQAHIPDPLDADLSEWLAAHPDTFQVEAKVATTLVYLSSARHADPTADAAPLLVALTNGADPTGIGDPWPHGTRSALRPISRAAAELGPSSALLLAEAPLGSWQTLQDRYGVHLLRVDDREVAHLPPLEEIRGQVAAHWRLAQEAAAQEAAAARRRARTQVEIERP